MSNVCLVLNQERCKGCSLCITVCARDVLRLSGGVNAAGYHPIETARGERCTGCTLCAWMCPDFVIAVDRRSEPSENVDERK
ncbi:MAG: 4Fe-4S dicluster domain-containing protein [Bacillota bacterium]